MINDHHHLEHRWLDYLISSYPLLLVPCKKAAGNYALFVMLTFYLDTAIVSKVWNEMKLNENENELGLFCRLHIDNSIKVIIIIIINTSIVIIVLWIFF